MDNKKYRLIIGILGIFTLGVLIYDEFYNEVGKLLKTLSHISILLALVFSYILGKKN